MSLRLQGKRAIVTGGGSGFGEGIVTQFAAEGAKVLIADRDEGNARRVAEATDSQWIHCDVTKAADVKAMIDSAASTSSSTTLEWAICLSRSKVSPKMNSTRSSRST